ncbi:MAG: hypothetical protein ACJ75J_09480 [Cytophagaceae bacterium]
MKNRIIAFVCCMALLIACKESKKEEVKETKTVESADAMKTTTDNLIMGVDKAWDSIIKQDDAKFASIKRLLDEISYTKKYDAVAQDALVKEIPMVKAKRFNPDNIEITNRAVEVYDSITDAYVLKVLALADKTKELESHPIAAELKEDITTANSPDIVSAVRNNYTQMVKVYNKYLEDNKEAIAKMGPPYNSLTPKKTFEQ